MADLTPSRSMKVGAQSTSPGQGGGDHDAPLTLRSTSKAVHGDSSDSGEHMNVQVMARVRPFNSRELGLESEPTSIVYMRDNTVTILDHLNNFSEKEAFSFDATFWSVPASQNQYSDKAFATQEDVFLKTGKPCVDAAIEGYNCTIFAYGQTGSGKTHSMLGTTSDPGISPRLVAYLFQCIAERSSQGNPSVFTVDLSFMEIYNERVKDLLAISAQDGKEKRRGSTSGQLSPRGATDKPDPYSDCKVRYNPEVGTYVEGLTRSRIETEEQCQAMIRAGMEHRAVAATQMNATSSRSHAIFQLCVRQKNPLAGTQKIAIINLVDLAGSEKVKLSGATGQTLTEAKNINQSLSTLRRVIDVLIENSTSKKKMIPPFRESVLTWVLSDSLGGNSKTIMVATISPYHGNLEDTLNTCRYALKAKAIVCNVHVNEEKSAVVVSAMKAEMDRLRRELADRKTVEADPEKAHELAEEIARRELEFQQTQYEQEQAAKKQKEIVAEIEKKKQDIQTLSVDLSKKLNIAQEVKDMHTKTKEAEQESRKKETEIEDTRTKTLQTEAEIKFQMQRRDSMERHAWERRRDEEKARLTALDTRRQTFVRVFRHATTINKEKNEFIKLTKEVARAKEKIAKVEIDVDEKRKVVQKLRAEHEQLMTTTDLLDRRTASRIQHFDHDVESKESQIRQLTEALRDLRTKLSRQQELINVNKQQLASAEEERVRNNAALREFVATNAQELMTAEVGNATVSQDLEGITAKVNIQREKVLQLRVSLKILKDEEQELQAKYTSFNDRYGTYRLEIANNERLLEENTLNLAILNADVDVGTNKSQELERTLNSLRENDDFARHYLENKLQPTVVTENAISSARLFSQAISRATTPRTLLRNQVYTPR